VGFFVYLVIKKFFPDKNVSGIDSDLEDINRLIDLQKEKDLTTEPSSLAKNNLPGRNVLNNPLVHKFLKFLNNKAVKGGLVALFTTAIIQHFGLGIKQFLVNKVFDEVCLKEVEGKLDIKDYLVKDHNLLSHSQSLRELLVTSNLSDDAKIKLLEIKLDEMINCEYNSKRRFMIVFILSILITFGVSGVGGIAIFFEALYRLAKDGKISAALYSQLVEMLVNIEDLENT
jgi:hypothetical protein